MCGGGRGESSLTDTECEMGWGFLKIPLRFKKKVKIILGLPDFHFESSCCCLGHKTLANLESTLLSLVLAVKDYGLKTLNYQMLAKGLKIA